MDFTRQISYQSDFKLTVHVVDANDAAVGFPDFDFLLTFTTSGNTKVEAGQQNGVQRNVKNVNGDIEVVFDNHKLLPGALNLEVLTNVANADYPDGKKQTIFKANTNISLVNGTGDGSTELTVDVKLPFAYAKASSSSSESTSSEAIEDSTSSEE